MLEVCITESLTIREIAASDTYLVNIHVHIHSIRYCSKHDVYSDSPSRFLSLVCSASHGDCFSRSRLPPRLEADTTSTPAAAAAAAAAAVVGLNSTKCSAPGAPSGSTQPKPSVVEAASSVVLTVSRPVSCLPFLAILRAFSAPYVVNFDGFPLFSEAFW